MSGLIYKGHSALDFARQACNRMIDKFAPEDLPPKGEFYYHQGVFLSGMQKTYELCQDKKYYDYIKAWVDTKVREDGSIYHMDRSQLDYIQPGVLLYPLYHNTKEEKYKKALDTLIQILKEFPKNEEGGFWHNGGCQNQMWLDGLFMGGPITAEYAARFQNRQLFDKVALQAKLMYQHNLDPQTGLLLHGWDESRQASWANRETGRSPEVWGRALGWYVTAMVDILDYLPASHPDYPVLLHILKELAPRIVRCQDAADGRWYQVVNKGNRPGNWLENSCSCLFVYAITKAVRKGYIDRKYWENAKKGYQGVIRSIAVDENRNVRVGDVCIGTGIGDYDYYIKRPTGVNDLHGVGAFLIMCAEMNLA